MAGVKNVICKITENQILNDSYFILTVKRSKEFGEILPGQFFEMRLPDDEYSLKIPISVYDANPFIIRFMIKTIGGGTDYLSTLEEGTELEIMGPLGNSFPMVEDKNVLLISGGIGYAPLYYLENELSKNNSVQWIHGGRSEEDIFDADMIATDDGSIGHKGFVTDLIDEALKVGKPDVIYCCGPDIMMKNCYNLLKDTGIPFYVSLEEYMACGIGVCYGCVVKIKEGDEAVFKTVCKDGPIFDASKVVWDD